MQVVKLNYENTLLKLTNIKRFYGFLIGLHIQMTLLDTLNKLVFNHIQTNIDADKLIIQIESLLHLRNNDLFVDDEDGVPIGNWVLLYDLVIIDEIESMLNQLSS